MARQHRVKSSDDARSKGIRFARAFEGKNFSFFADSPFPAIKLKSAI
jgi:hypothetical protein